MPNKTQVKMQSKLRKFNRPPSHVDTNGPNTKRHGELKHSIVRCECIRFLIQKNNKMHETVLREKSRHAALHLLANRIAGIHKCNGESVNYGGLGIV